MKIYNFIAFETYHRWHMRSFPANEHVMQEQMTNLHMFETITTAKQVTPPKWIAAQWNHTYGPTYIQTLCFWDVRATFQLVANKINKYQTLFIIYNFHYICDRQTHFQLKTWSLIANHTNNMVFLHSDTFPTISINFESNPLVLYYFNTFP